MGSQNLDELEQQSGRISPPNLEYPNILLYQKLDEASYEKLPAAHGGARTMMTNYPRMMNDGSTTKAGGFISRTTKHQTHFNTTVAGCKKSSPKRRRPLISKEAEAERERIRGLLQSNYYRNNFSGVAGEVQEVAISLLADENNGSG